MKKSSANLDYNANFERKRAFEKEISLNRAKNYTHIFESARAKQIIEHIKGHYGDELEFLWLDLPNAAIFRHKDNQKWYAVIMAIKARKVGLKSDESINIINLKAKPEFIDDFVDNARYFRAYHMNKTHWLSVKLDESVDLNTLCELVKTSYEMTGKKQGR